MTYFLDFDRTLFDTDAFVAHLMKRSDVVHLRHEPEERLAAFLNDEATRGTLTFTPGELVPFVFADVPDTLRKLGADAVILTYGNPELQKLKIENALPDTPRIPVLYTGPDRKGIFMRNRIDGYGSALHVDDNPVELASLTEHCPQMQLFEMRRDGGSGDGRWPVIHSLADLP